MKSKLTAVILLLSLMLPLSAAFTDTYLKENVMANPSLVTDDVFLLMPVSRLGSRDFTKEGEYAASFLIGMGSFGGGADLSLTAVREADGRYTVKPVLSMNILAGHEAGITDTLNLSLGAAVSYGAAYTKSGIDESQLRIGIDSGTKLLRAGFEKNGERLSHVEAVMLTYKNRVRGVIKLRDFNTLSTALSFSWKYDFIDFFAEVSLSDVFRFSDLTPGAEARITLHDSMSLLAGYERGLWKIGADLRLLCLRLYGEYRGDGTLSLMASVFC